LFSIGTNYPHGYRLKERYVYDYEVEFIIFSEGSMIIDEQHHIVKQGDVVFRRPGQYTQGIMPYNCYLICMDMLSNIRQKPASYDFCKSQSLCINKKNKNITEHKPTPPLLDAIPQFFIHSIRINTSTCSIRY
jgi:Pyruvate/2-oxoacid:ferredoxin oxidoreductase delta subunit